MVSPNVSLLRLLRMLRFHLHLLFVCLLKYLWADFNQTWWKGEARPSKALGFEDYILVLICIQVDPVILEIIPSFNILSICSNTIDHHKTGYLVLIYIHLKSYFCLLQIKQLSTIIYTGFSSLCTVHMLEKWWTLLPQINEVLFSIPVAHPGPFCVDLTGHIQLILLEQHFYLDLFGLGRGMCSNSCPASLCKAGLLVVWTQHIQLHSPGSPRERSYSRWVLGAGNLDEAVEVFLRKQGKAIMFPC